MRIKNVPVKVAAAILGIGQQRIRIGLQRKFIDWGFAVTSDPDKKPRPYYSYHISVPMFKEYAGCTDEDIIRWAKALNCDLDIDE